MADYSTSVTVLIAISSRQAVNIQVFFLYPIVWHVSRQTEAIENHDLITAWIDSKEERGGRNEWGERKKRHSASPELFISP